MKWLRKGQIEFVLKLWSSLHQHVLLTLSRVGWTFVLDQQEYQMWKSISWASVFPPLQTAPCYSPAMEAWVLHPFLLKRRRLGRHFKMKKATEQNPPLSASTAVNSCKTELGSGTPSSARSPGGPSVWPAGCFQPGLIHGTAIRRIRAVTESSEAAHILLKMLSESRTERHRRVELRTRARTESR